MDCFSEVPESDNLSAPLIFPRRNSLESKCDSLNTSFPSEVYDANDLHCFYESKVIGNKLLNDKIVKYKKSLRSSLDENELLNDKIVRYKKSLKSSIETSYPTSSYSESEEDGLNNFDNYSVVDVFGEIGHPPELEVDCKLFEKKKVVSEKNIHTLNDDIVPSKIPYGEFTPDNMSSFDEDEFDVYHVSSSETSDQNNKSLNYDGFQVKDCDADSNINEFLHDFEDKDDCQASTNYDVNQYSQPIANDNCTDKILSSKSDESELVCKSLVSKSEGSSKMHLKYRVFSGGSFLPPVKDIVVNKEIMLTILHRHISYYLEQETDVQIASRLQAFMWPVVTRGQNVIAVGERDSGKTLGYILPLVSLLLDMWPCIEHEASSRVGAVAVIVCKGWLDAQSVASTISELLVDTKIRVVATWGGLGKDSINDVHKKICSGADILVTTLPFLLRLIGLAENDEEKIQFNLLSHCFHLILDDADVTLENDATGVKSLLREWASSRAESNYKHFSQQLIVTASSWTDYTKSLTSFLSSVMEPAIIISAPLEAARATSVQSKLHCIQTDKFSHFEIFGQVVDLVKQEYTSKKVLIIVKNSRDAKKVSRLFKSVAIFNQVVNGRMLMWQVQEEVKQWNSSNKGKVFITTASTVARLLEQDLMDAQVIIHVDIPKLKSEFSQRFSFMIENYAVCEDVADVPCSHIFYEENEVLPRYLNKCLRNLGTELINTTKPTFDENYDPNIPICHLLKSSGVCSAVHLCTWRHIVLPEDKICSLPDKGIVSLEIVKILNASRYLVRLLDYRESNTCQPLDLSNNYFVLFMTLQNFCSDTERLVTCNLVDIGSLCLVQNNSVWSRARVLQKHATYYKLFLLDEGDEIDVSIDVMYKLPQEFTSLPQLVLEVYLSNVCPVDKDTEWTHNANVFVEKLLTECSEGTKFSGNIVLTLSSTLWISPLVEILKVEDTLIRGESIRSRLMRKGYGTDNSNHIESLKEQIVPISPPENSIPWINFWNRE